MITRKQNLALTALLITGMLLIQVPAPAKTLSDLSKESIIPNPVSITATGGYFEFKPGTRIYVQGEHQTRITLGRIH